jgi:hypothetical protein
MITNWETFRDDSIASNLWRRSAVAIPFWLTLAPQPWIYARRDISTASVRLPLALPKPMHERPARA